MIKDKPFFISIILIIVIGSVVYANSLNGKFLWDDRDLILKNGAVHDIKNIPLFFTAKYWDYQHPGINGQYRPISVISIAIDYSLWQNNPFGYHLTNLLLHILNCILVYILGLMLINGNKARDGLLNLAFLGALFFAVHPIHTESVAWIKNRFDLISLAFFLSSLVLFIRYMSRNRSNAVYLGTLVLFILALLSKEMSITLPFILLIYALYFIPKEDKKEAIKATMPFFGFAAFYVVLKYAELLKTVSSDDTPRLIFTSHILLVFKTIAYYIKLLILPIHLNAERMLEIPVSILEPSVLLSILSIIVLLIIAVITYNRLKIASFSILWMLFTLLPASNIIFLASRPIAEQRLYIPSVGFCLILAACLNSLYDKRLQRTAISITILVLIFYSYATFMRNSDWRDPLIFWEKTVVASPYSSRAHNNLGFEYFESGDVEKAVSSYKKAMELNPEYVTSYNNLGVAYQHIGKYQDAIRLFNKTLELDPNYADAYNNLGNIHMLLNEYEEAIESYKKALEINPEHGDVYNNLAVLYYYDKEYGLAVKYCDKAVELKAPVNYEFLRLLNQYR